MRAKIQKIYKNIFDRLEVILSSIYLTIQGLQLVFGLISAASFYKGT